MDISNTQSRLRNGLESNSRLKGTLFISKWQSVTSGYLLLHRLYTQEYMMRISQPEKLFSDLAKAVIFFVIFGSYFASTNLSAADSAWLPPLTASGAPDLQGIWSNATMTPFERPAELGTQKSYTEAEAMAVEKAAHEIMEENSLALATDRGAPSAGGGIGQQAVINFMNTPVTRATTHCQAY